MVIRTAMAAGFTFVPLTVGDARLRDVGEGIARLSNAAIAKLALRPGDRILIRAQSDLIVQALPAGPEDDGLDLIRLDASERRQLGVDIGDAVDVRCCPARVAEH